MAYGTLFGMERAHGVVVSACAPQRGLLSPGAAANS